MRAAGRTDLKPLWRLDHGQAWAWAHAAAPGPALGALWGGSHGRLQQTWEGSGAMSGMHAHLQAHALLHGLRALGAHLHHRAQPLHLGSAKSGQAGVSPSGVVIGEKFMHTPGASASLRKVALPCHRHMLTLPMLESASSLQRRACDGGMAGRPILPGSASEGRAVSSCLQDRLV